MLFTVVSKRFFAYRLKMTGHFNSPFLYSVGSNCNTLTSILIARSCIEVLSLLQDTHAILAIITYFFDACPV